LGGLGRAARGDARECPGGASLPRCCRQASNTTIGPQACFGSARGHGTASLPLSDVDGQKCRSPGPSDGVETHETRPRPPLGAGPRWSAGDRHGTIETGWAGERRMTHRHPLLISFLLLSSIALSVTASPTHAATSDASSLADSSGASWFFPDSLW